jgi:hypothetical protein
MAELRSVELQWIDGADPGSGIEALMAGLSSTVPHLQELSLFAVELPSAVLAPVSACRQLRSLRLQNCKFHPALATVTDAVLQLVQSLRQIEDVCISGGNLPLSAQQRASMTPPSLLIARILLDGIAQGKGTEHGCEIDTTDNCYSHVLTWCSTYVDWTVWLTPLTHLALPVGPLSLCAFQQPVLHASALLLPFPLPLPFSSPSAVMGNSCVGGGFLDDLIRRVSRNDPSLTTIDLSANQEEQRLDDAGWQQLCEALVTNSSVKKLKLQDFHSEKRFASLQFLAQMLEQNKTLTSLELRSVSLDKPADVALLAAALQKHPALECSCSTIWKQRNCAHCTKHLPVGRTRNCAHSG